ncbi:mycothiol transferase [Streptomyces fulvorobeus]
MEPARRHGSTATGEHHGVVLSLRPTHVPMIAEFARHIGHADLRERLDGATGS